MIGTAKRRAIDELKGEIELKESVVKASQEIFARQLRGELGVEIKKELSKKDKPKRKNLWTKLNENFLKIVN